MHDKTIENVVVISLDCVRPEALGCYPQRYPLRVRLPQGARTPNIDHLSANGHRFDQAFTHVPFTPCAHASLLTGLNPPRHGLRTLLGSKLDHKAVTLAELLSARGWQCGAVVGAQALSRDYGLARGFHYYDDDIQTGISNWKLGQRREAEEVTDRAVTWLNSLNNNRPFFLFVHYFDAHTISLQSNHLSTQNGLSVLTSDSRLKLPSSIKALLRPAARFSRSLYYFIARKIRTKLLYYEKGGRYNRYGRRYQLNQVAKIDTQIGRLIQTLLHQNTLDKTLIIVLADHGDDFMERAELNHGEYLYDTTLRVPLIIYPRLDERSIVKEQVRLVDVFPTVLSILDIDVENDIDGDSVTDLLSTMPGAGIDIRPRKVYSETAWESVEDDAEGVNFLTCYASLRTPSSKLIWNRIENTYELYCVDVDPVERHNLASSEPQRVINMLRELRELAQTIPLDVEAPDRAVVDRLKSLGYL
jgi:arylsulfatase A-like enzyme